MAGWGESQGGERERGYGSYLVRAAEIVPGALSGRPMFPFQSWADANGFAYPAAALPLMRLCGSAAEAFFVRPFANRAGFAMDGEGARAGTLSLRLQVPCAGFRIDAVIAEGSTQIAVEIDGMAFHHRSKEQVAADYLRQRRIVAKGFTVIRYTAQEAFGAADECWRQIDIILAARRAL